MRRLRVLCGLLALTASVLVLHASAAQSRAATCSGSVVRVGAVWARGCWRHVGSRWVSPTPVVLDGLKLTGGGAVTADPAAGTIQSSRSVHWLIGRVQIRHAPFRWHRRTQLAFAVSGAVRGLGFTGNGALGFTAADGGTATLTAKVEFQALAGTTVSGDAVLAVSRRHPFDVRKVHVSVDELALERLLFKKLDFQYSNSVWSADAAVRLPAFTISDATIDGHIEIGNGTVRDIAIGGSGLTVPLGEGLILNKASLSLNFHPVVIQGRATATYGPPIAGASPLQVDGSLQYSSQGHHWDANGAVTLPWGLPGVKPSLTVELGLDPGRSISFGGQLNMTVHGYGVTGNLQGFASPKAFNVEGDAALTLPAFTLHGDGLISSKGMGACGHIHLSVLGFGVSGPRIGFGYPWGGGLHFIASSCDVGAFRVAQTLRAASSASSTIVTAGGPAQFAVFAVQGQSFQVSPLDNPTVVFSTAVDNDSGDFFSFHDTSDDTYYLAIPVPSTPTPYLVTTATPAAAGAVAVADGLPSLAGLVTGTVTGSGNSTTLNYTINTPLPPGETVSFYEGQSPDPTVPGANPIVEDVSSSGSATFTPEPTGSTTRTVTALVSYYDVPRESFPIATFTTTDVPLPFAAIFIHNTPTPPGGWTIQLLKPARVAAWEIVTSTDDGRHDAIELPATTTTYSIPLGTATHVSAQITPVDQYGREGLTSTCDSAKPGFCPPS